MAIWRALADLYTAFGLIPAGTVFSDLPSDSVPRAVQPAPFHHRIGSPWMPMPSRNFGPLGRCCPAVACPCGWAAPTPVGSWLMRTLACIS